MTIKVAQKKDLDKCINVRLEMLKVVNNLSQDYKFSDLLINETRKYYENGNQTTVLAIDDSDSSNLKVIGCATLSYIYIMPTFSHPTGNRGHLMNVYTNPDYRHQGIASKMVKILIEEATSKGVTEISLDATDMGRPVYSKLGFMQNETGMVLEIKN